MIVVSLALVITVMIRSSDEMNAAVERAPEKPPGADAIEDALKVFDSYDSSMDSAQKERSDEDRKRQEAEAARKREEAKRAREEKSGQEARVSPGKGSLEFASSSELDRREPPRTEPAQEVVASGAKRTPPAKGRVATLRRPLPERAYPLHAFGARLSRFESSEVAVAKGGVIDPMEVLREKLRGGTGPSSVSQPGGPVGELPESRLSPPLFSMASGTYSLDRFDLSLRLADPNPETVSQLLYSLDGGPWKTYEGMPVVVPPGAVVGAYCRSDNPRWRDSTRETREYSVRSGALLGPGIAVSATAFQEGPDRTVWVSLSDRNAIGAADLEYRLNGGPWRIFRDGFGLSSRNYIESGVLIEARSVPVDGAERNLPSEIARRHLEGPRALKKGTAEGETAAGGGLENSALWPAPPTPSISLAAKAKAGDLAHGPKPGGAKEQRGRLSALRLSAEPMELHLSVPAGVHGYGHAWDLEFETSMTQPDHHVEGYYTHSALGLGVRLAVGLDSRVTESSTVPLSPPVAGPAFLAALDELFDGSLPPKAGDIALGE
ncbi:MAG: hypothetical protein ACC661_09710 [Verrucomicrobiales bacterium]